MENKPWEKLFTEEELRMFAEKEVIVVASRYRGNGQAQKQRRVIILCLSWNKGLFLSLLQWQYPVARPAYFQRSVPLHRKGWLWYQRSYKLIAMSKDTNKYKGKQKWWTPNFNSTCIAIPENELSLFEHLILQPYFNLTLGDLLPDAVSPEQPNTGTEELPESPTPYTREDFLNEVYISESDLDTLLHLLERKKNIILQGAPGVGKTFAAEKLAYAMMKEADKKRIKFIQFHQNYSYEDFIMGYKPTEDGGFKLENGVFYNFCKKAAADKDRPYFFIIDEINPRQFEQNLWGIVDADWSR